MRKRVEEIQRKIAELEKDAEELRFLKSACEDMKKMRKKIVQTKYD
jgi:type II secretory pathway component PulJ